MSQLVRDSRIRNAGGRRGQPSLSVEPGTTARSGSFEPADALLPAAVLLWLISIPRVDPGAMTDWGLLAALPVSFFLAAALLCASIVRIVSRRKLSTIRLVLHLGALVLLLHGTIPAIFPSPSYPWVYKHIGVVEYANLHGGVSAGVDIYHNWPGFFALGAFYTLLAGEVTPLVFAGWAPVFFNLVACLQLAFVYRYLPLPRRAAWTALFLFVGGNWVAQDYFAPQALGFLLGLGTSGLVLAWVRSDRCISMVNRLQRLLQRFARGPLTPDDRPQPSGPRSVALAVLYATFAMITVTHQLTPFMILAGLVAGAAAGFLRPRWVIAVLAAIALGYLVARYQYLDESQHDLFGSLLDPFRNLFATSPSRPRPMTGRLITAFGAPFITIGMFGLAALGVFRRVREGMPTLLLALLALSPVAIAVLQNYGGEVRFRVFLFALPWLAALGGCAVTLGRRRNRLWNFLMWMSIPVSVALLLMTSLGAQELNEVRPSSVQASRYFYRAAPPGSMLAALTLSFPHKVSANYNEFQEESPQLLRDKDFIGLKLERELPRITRYLQSRHRTGRGGVYLAVSDTQARFASVLNLVPPHSVEALERAMVSSGTWREFYRNSEARIYEAMPAPPRLQPGPSLPAKPAASAPAVGHLLAIVAAGAVGIRLVMLNRGGQRRLVAVPVKYGLERTDMPTVSVPVPPDLGREETMDTAPQVSDSPRAFTPERPGAARDKREDWIAVGMVAAAAGMALARAGRRRQRRDGEDRYMFKFHLDTTRQGRTDAGRRLGSGRERTSRRAGASVVRRRGTDSGR